MFFTREDIEKIHQGLLRFGIKDSELPETINVNSDDTLAVVQDGKNKKINIEEFLNNISLFKKEGFINITDRFNKHSMSLMEAIQTVPTHQRIDGLVITFEDINGDWRIYQFRGDAVDFFAENKWTDMDNADEISDIYKIIYNQHASVSLYSNVSGNIIEKGVDKSVTLHWNYIFNGATTIPDSLQLKSGDSVLVSDKSTKTLTETISDSKSYQAVAVMKGVTKTASLTINAYYPIYYGGALDGITSEEILNMTKHSSIKANAVGNYSFSVNDYEYAWICVPEGMTINKVTSGGFEVPMEPVVVVTVKGKGSYNCYRSSKQFKAGTFNCTVQ